MKKQLLIILTIIFSLDGFSQIHFEKGYYINNAGQKVDCLIKNIEWKNNPTEFDCKHSENESVKVISIMFVKEFGIYNLFKYKRDIVNIDRSSENIDHLSTDRNPIFKKEQLFLKVLIEGKANLYYYEDGNLKRYFYSKNNSNIEQLIYKSYWATDFIKSKNLTYRQQLWNKLKCQGISKNLIENIEYKKNDMINFFLRYNKCNNSESVNLGSKQKKWTFDLSVRPGLNSSSLNIQNSVSDLRDVDFGNELGFRLGVETEFIMPFNKNKWAILLEPTYQYFKSEKELATQNVRADYKSIELPVGLRHYLFLNDNSKIFINASYIFDFSFNSIIDFESAMDFYIMSRNNLAFGIGYNYNKKYSLELRYQTSRDIIGSTWGAQDSDYKTISVIFGYSIF
ncbi:MAG: tRNA modification GTPase [Bacteroidota bacterium]